jgi:hypothetical protein
VALCAAELAAVGESVAAEPDRYEFHHQDETHVETNPYLRRVWHRRGSQPTVAAGTDRRLTVFGSVEVFGRGRVGVLTVGQDSAGFVRYLEALEARQLATGREVYLVLDNGPCHTSQASRAPTGGTSSGWRSSACSSTRSNRNGSASTASAPIALTSSTPCRIGSSMGSVDRRPADQRDGPPAWPPPDGDPPDRRGARRGAGQPPAPPVRLGWRLGAKS